MREPRAGEVVTDASLVSALRSAVRPWTTSRSPSAVIEVRIGDATAHTLLKEFTSMFHVPYSANLLPRAALEAPAKGHRL